MHASNTYGHLIRPSQAGNTTYDARAATHTAHPG